MVAEWSTAISDAFLALASFHASQRVSSASYLASIGFGIIGAAASCGSVRFGLSQPSYSIISWHKYMAWVASVAGFPLLAAGYGRRANINVVSNALLAASAAVLLLQKNLGPKVSTVCGDFLGAVGLASLLLINVTKGNFYGIIGAVLCLVGSLLFKAEQGLGIIRPVDVFHYALMLGNISMMLGLIQEQPPIYYKNR